MDGNTQAHLVLHTLVRYSSLNCQQHRKMSQRSPTKMPDCGRSVALLKTATSEGRPRATDELIWWGVADRRVYTSFRRQLKEINF